MAAKIIVNILLIITLGIAQISFISGWSAPYSDLNLVLVILIFILGFASFNLAVWWSFGVGFILEIFFFLPFGAYLISLILTIIIANFLLDYFFTNRSLYSFLALVALATAASELIINFMAYIFIEANRYFFPVEPAFWLSLLEQIGLNLLLTFFIYYLVHFFGRNLRPVFLMKIKK
ncbi:MAG: hypothetical protein UU95_C0003G0057 [Parcubacteria group bacterium GW2011_GWC2_42_12]|uniref:Rod shape-determining protein MreD n=2 Tax=Candidatus Falkowiibacteriota TaxID=1752728 RepID=A0A1F5S857_9BACT|nr:MAG: hypothetical protein UU43_C0002G0044 [Candidatus Falkowbacteria bacterium GW2011_GWA2_41_14]KKS35284.1 MAG: hypothetical protein UU95_C0003G0057 [Parcubacteria group bacterium GW2011_GWC2_42_12]OGF22895.1 MAG: hypothetical protein A3D45_00960 [Candidatus Falkowbacteria bacterium RIFCSPHIGHO2_02_FULL_42_9]